MNSLSLIAAVSANGVIGKDGGIPWSMEDDKGRFQHLVKGRALIMGSRTYDSHVKKMLNAIVVTRKGQDAYPAALVVPTVAEAVRRAWGDAFVLGGESIFAATIGLADRIYLTQIHTTIHNGDAYFPSINWRDWRPVHWSTYRSDAFNPHPWSYLDLVRKKS
jgi:dihydrofolate reductase